MRNTERIRQAALCALVAVSALATSAAVRTFTGAADNTWNNAANWEGGYKPVDGDSVVMTSAQSTINNNIGELRLAGLTYNGSVQVSRFEGSTITLAAGAGFANQTTLRFQIPMNLVLEAGSHEFLCNGRVDVSGVISGSGGIEKTGSNMIALSGNNSFSGGFTATSGSVYYTGNGAAFGSGTATFAQGVQLYCYANGLVATTPLTLGGENAMSTSGNILLRYSTTIDEAVTFASEGRQRAKATGDAGADADVVLRFGKTVTYSGTGTAFVNNMGNGAGRGVVFAQTVNWPDGEISQVNNCFTRFEGAGNRWRNFDLQSGVVYLPANGLAADMDILFTHDATAYCLGGDLAVRRLSNSPNMAGTHFVEATAPAVLTVRETESESYDGALNGALSLVYDPADGETWTLTQGGSMSGTVTVKGGRLVLDGAELASVTALVVEGDASVELSNNASLSYALDELNVPSGSALVGFAGQSFRVKRLVVGGVEYVGGDSYTVGGATIEVVLAPGPGTEYAWNAGGGLDTDFEQNLNWQGSATPVLGPMTLPRFTAGSAATGSRALDFSGFVFDVGNDFAVGGASPISVYWSGLAFTSAFAGRTATFAAPVKLAGDQVWDVPANVTLKFTGGLAPARDATHTLVTGTGTVQFDCANTTAGDFVVSNGSVVVTKDDGVGDSDSVGALHLRRTDDTKLTSSLTLHGVTLGRDLHLESPDDYTANCIVKTGPSTTNVLAGRVTVDDTAMKRISLGARSQLVFAGGIDCPNASVFLHGSGGEAVISNTPATVKLLYLGNGTAWRLAVSGNAVSSLSSEGSGLYSIEADNVFSAGQPALTMAAGDRMELNGHDVSLSNMSGGDATSKISSGEPATIVCSQQQGGTLAAAISGPISLVKSGANAKTLSLSGDSTASGTLECASGLMNVYGKWLGDMRVTTAGAIIRFQPGATTGRNVTAMVGNGGKIGLNAGVRVKVSRLVVNGVEQLPGTYGSSNSAAEHQDDSIFEKVTSGNPEECGTGILEVKGVGMMLIFR